MSEMKLAPEKEAEIAVPQRRKDPAPAGNGSRHGGGGSEGQKEALESYARLNYRFGSSLHARMQTLELPECRTKTAILDAAERLFARRGFEATSLRTITAEAGANLGAVNYHFTSKDGLILAVVKRMFQPVNEHRLRLLDELEMKAHGKPLPVDAILEALFRPPLEVVASRHRGDGSFPGCSHFASRSRSLPEAADGGSICPQDPAFSGGAAARLPGADNSRSPLAAALCNRRIPPHSRQSTITGDHIGRALQRDRSGGGAAEDCRFLRSGFPGGRHPGRRVKKIFGFAQ